jgi:predicted dehydrogenase/diketogulonate reductase-like aldo/keto reductase
VLPTVRFEASGVELTRIGFGCASLMRTPSARQRQTLLAAAYDAGIRHFDVARLYGLGQAEGELGRFARGRRDKLTIATKFGIEPASGLGPLAKVQAPIRALLNRFPALRGAVKRRDDAFVAPRRYDRTVAQQHLDRSLRELGVDYVDILFIHDPAPHDDVRAEELVAFLTAAREAGKIRAWGVSQDAHPELDVINRLGPSAILQIRADAFHPVASAEPRLTFGVLGSAYARISSALTADPVLRTRWAEALDIDPARENELARLLVADALAANPDGAILYSTTRAARMGVAAAALIDPPPSAVLDAFRGLYEGLRDRPESKTTRRGPVAKGRTGIALVGCGYVADHYMQTAQFHPDLEVIAVTDRDPERAAAIAAAYDVATRPTLEAVLEDEAVEIVVNLTDPNSHFEVTWAALTAGKHVYSEKPLAMSLTDAQRLHTLARERSLLLSGAPCSVLSETAQTLWCAIESGIIGRPRVVYAELDDNPIYLMRPEGWTNERGVRWPYLGEYEVGCTLEHAGYYLTWLCALFGPALSVTAFSKCLVPDKTDVPLEPADTPDFSVACIEFENGVVARLTCSIVGPYDHRLRIIGDEGMLSVDECWQYAAPVNYERFSQLSLNARKSRTVRAHTMFQTLFGVGGRKVRSVSRPMPNFTARLQEVKSGRRNAKGALIAAISKRELVSMDFLRGVSEMGRAIRGEPNALLPDDFVLHVAELALAMQGARDGASATYIPVTTFDPLRPTAGSSAGFVQSGRAKVTTRALEAAIGRLHRH